MELKEIILKLNSYKISILFSVIIGAIVGLGFFYLPSKYISTGTLYIKRAVDSPNNQFFGYEGYYGQQTAISFTNTVLALVESADIKEATLKKLGILTNEYTLKKYDSLIKSKKAGSQLITITVKGNSPEMALNLWNAVTDSVISASKTINQTGDPNLNVSKVSNIPITTPQYKPIWICITGGMMLFLAVSIFILSFKEYFKWK